VSHFFAKHLGIGEKARAKMQAYLERKTGHSFASLGLTHIAPQIKQPVLAIYDENDPDILPENAEAIGRELPHAALRRTQGLGHHRILKDGKLIQDVTQFLLATVI
jgi:pimeloyl-ACP methyl ester carboxylesterase